MGITLPKISKRLEVFNKENNESAELFMYGSIGSGWFSDISSKDIQSKLSQIKAKTINIHINSPGGDVFESIAIANQLKNHSSTIVVHIDALAASGASVIAMAADKIVMPKNTMMMIHRAWTVAYGNASELKKAAADLEKIDTAVTESYTSRFVGERSELEEMLLEDCWLTAEECKALGFCDEITDEIEIKEEEEEETAANISARDRILNKYYQNSSTQQQEEQKVDDEPPQNETKMKNANIMINFLNSFQTLSKN